MYKKIRILFFLSMLAFSINAQEIPTQLSNDSSAIDFSVPKEYIIGGVVVNGAEHLDNGVLILLSGLANGDKVQVPGEKFSTAISNLWKQGLFEDIKFTGRVQGDKIFITINVVERPRLLKFSLKGMTKSEADDLREKIKLYKGTVVTDRLVASTASKIKEFFVTNLRPLRPERSALPG